MEMNETHSMQLTANDGIRVGQHPWSSAEPLVPCTGFILY